MDLVEVTWEDAESRLGWMTPEEVETQCASSLLCVQIGALVHKSRKAVVLSGGYNTLGHAQGLMRIPRGMVRKIRVLGKATEIK